MRRLSWTLAIAFGVMIYTFAALGLKDVLTRESPTTIRIHNRGHETIYVDVTHGDKLTAYVLVADGRALLPGQWVPR